ncbi:Innexin family-containing protein [Aphelenchoides besseyi]|nr:Innexin family-containing protein [Aphelenchoides besseyi]
MLLYYFASAVKSVQFHVDDDIIDKLNYYYTTSIIIVFAILVSGKQYVGHPIQCWVPATFTEPMEEYTEHYCWVQNTYFLPLGEFIPSQPTERENRQIGYYQWVPFILALEAVFFYVPTIVWRFLTWQTGIHVQSIVHMACECRMLDNEARKRAFETMASNIQEAIHVKHQLGTKRLKLLNFLICTRSSGASVTILYITIKILYTINVFLQILLLNAFLGARGKFYGLEVLGDIMNGREWTESGHFPRVTLCDFEVKVLGNVHRHTVQCVLMINMFNEKIFLFLWCWYVILGAATFFSLLYWIFISIVPSRQLNFVGKYLSGMEGYKIADSQTLRRFVHTYLRHDGVFLLRMVATHAGELSCYELAIKLWKNYHDNKDGRPHDTTAAAM